MSDNTPDAPSEGTDAESLRTPNGAVDLLDPSAPTAAADTAVSANPFSIDGDGDDDEVTAGDCSMSATVVSETPPSDREGDATRWRPFVLT
mmetsp:Transcript_12796/g.27102  ORF Transcript_12796/g.27102 Transcript_12796/m.27102 type:complete len:91 (-) Transcript_12796:656-928(-)